MPRREHQNHRGALAPGVLEEPVKCLGLGGRKGIKAFHVNAVEGRTGFGGQGTDLVLVQGTETDILQNAALRSRDGGGLGVGVPLHGIELDGVALIIGHGGLPPVL